VKEATSGKADVKRIMRCSRQRQPDFEAHQSLRIVLSDEIAIETRETRSEADKQN